MNLSATFFQNSFARVLPIVVFLFAAVTLCTLTNSAAAQVPNWRSEQPKARTSHAMAFDSARGVTVMFGGFASSRSPWLGDTWEWNGDTWTIRTNSGPSPRYGHAMAFDSARGVTVLHGGWDNTNAQNGETWEWDGAVWTLRSTAGPGPLSNHNIAYDPVRRVTVLFAGQRDRNTDLGETWEWNGDAWSRRSTTGPLPRYDFGLVYDQARAVTLLVGGRNYAGTIFHDTWAWDGNQWNRLAETGITLNDRHCLVYDSVRAVTVGCTFTYNSATTLEWNGIEWASRVVNGPIARNFGAMSYDSTRGVTVLFGGSISSVECSDTWEYDGDVWAKTAIRAPAPRQFHAMVFDSERGVTVLFGGITPSGDSSWAYLCDTWEWNGTRWFHRAVSGPSPRSGHAMIYDSVRRVVVLFGGSSGSGMNSELGDTWEWNGVSWRQRGESGPPRRSNHAMAYDSSRGKTVLFGGSAYSGGNFTTRMGDTWEWDGHTWTQQLANGPSARFYHGMTYDSTRGVCVLFGGSETDELGLAVYIGDTWEWNGATWSRPALSGPVGRGKHAMAYDSNRQCTVLHGGSDGTTYPSLGDTWEWDGTNWSQIATATPLTRVVHSMVYDSTRHVTVQFGGVTSFSSTPFNDIFEYDGTRWTLRSSPIISPRFGHAIAYDNARRVAVLFGGLSSDVNKSSGTWENDGTGWTLCAASGPSPREFHSMAFDSRRNVTVLFGGSHTASNGALVYNRETWEWDGISWTLRSSNGPSARRAHAMAYDLVRGVTVIHGGHSASPLFYGDTWEWNGLVWTQRTSAGPSPRIEHAMAFDSVRGNIVLFGGRISASGVISNDLWERSGLTWTRRTVSGPSARKGHAMAFDSLRGLTVLFGGYAGTDASGREILSNETWQYDGLAWVQHLDANPPAGRFSHAMAFDSTNGETVLFGGLVDYSRTGDTWRLGVHCHSPTITSQPNSAVVCPGSTWEFSTITAGDSISYQWQRELTPGIGLWSDLSDGSDIVIGTVSGSSTSTLVISNIRAGPPTALRCIVSDPCATVTSVSALLTVCNADFNCDGSLDLFDYLDFVEAFAGSDLRTDFNHDGLLDIFDYLDFTESLSQGC